MDQREYDVTTAEAAERVGDVVERVESAAVVDRETLEAMLAAVLSRGHVLIEDVPGTGKTVIARVLAEAMGLSFTRIQFTPDLLPSDVTGSTVYDEQTGEFSFVEGPVFANVVLADEINRAPPKTQAALLEAMEERQVSADGETHDLPRPFVVIATQNPIEQEGTFRLPEAQRDRFNVKTSLGYPDVDGEMELLAKRDARRSLAPTVDPVTGPGTILDLQELAEDVAVDPKVRRYIIDIARQTREDPRTEVGVSPRGIQRVFELARSRAVIHGREFVTPEDVKQLAPAAMAHRLVLTTEATVENVDPRDVVADALRRVEVPAVSPGRDDSGAAGGQTTDAGAPPHPDAPADADTDGTGTLSRSPQEGGGESADPQGRGGAPREDAGGDDAAGGGRQFDAADGSEPADLTDGANGANSGGRDDAATGKPPDDGDGPTGPEEVGRMEWTEDPEHSEGNTGDDEASDADQ